MDRIDISKRLGHFRQRAEMTQRELAEKIGVSPQAVSKWESDDEWDPTRVACGARQGARCR